MIVVIYLVPTGECLISEFETIGSMKLRVFKIKFQFYLPSKVSDFFKLYFPLNTVHIY